MGFDSRQYFFAYVELFVFKYCSNLMKYFSHLIEYIYALLNGLMN